MVVVCCLQQHSEAVEPGAVRARFVAAGGKIRPVRPLRASFVLENSSSQSICNINRSVMCLLMTNSANPFKQFELSQFDSQIPTIEAQTSPVLVGLAMGKINAGPL